jgi:hypothetical protein
MLMDGGSGLNNMYVEMLDAMGINRSCIQLTRAPFHGIVLGKQAKPLGQIDLPVTFGDKSNLRIETLTFEVVGFYETYHTILGWPRYAKFMAVPKYTYLKLKMPSPHGVITVGTSFQRAYECDLECCELSTMTITSEELAATRVATVEEAPDSKRLACSFEPMENTKEILVNPPAPTTRCCASAQTFLLNRKVRSSTSSTRTMKSSHGNPQICHAFRGKSPIMP